jgi:hypothetical protein
MGLSLPMICAEIYNISQVGMGLVFGIWIFIIGATLLLVSGFFSKWRYWSVVALSAGVICIIGALLGLLHDEAIEAARSAEAGRVYSFNYDLWIRSLMPGLACIIWGFIKFLGDFVYKSQRFWLAYIVTGIILTMLCITLIIIQSANILHSVEGVILWSIWFLPGLVFIVEGIILKLRYKKQQATVAL